MDSVAHFDFQRFSFNQLMILKLEILNSASTDWVPRSWVPTDRLEVHNPLHNVDSSTGKGGIAMILKLEGEHEEMDADKSASETATDGEKAEYTDEKEVEEEEPSNLQLAWEMLELTKVVYTKQIETGADNKSEMEEKLCSSILALGDVSI